MTPPQGGLVTAVGHSPLPIPSEAPWASGQSLGPWHTAAWRQLLSVNPIPSHTVLAMIG